MNLKNSGLAFVIMFSLLFGTLAGILANADDLEPDLTIIADTISVFPDEIYENDQVKINFTVENLGGLDVDNVGIALYVNSRDNPVDEVHIASLPAGEGKEVTLYWIAKESGNYTLFVLVDFEEMIAESNEDNNMGRTKITVKTPVYQPFPPSPENAEWWNPEWHYRVPMSATMMGQREGYVYENKMVYCTVNFTALMDEISSYQPSGGFSERTFYPNSVRVVRYSNDNNTWRPVESVGREIIFNDGYDAAENANVTLEWVMDGTVLPHEVRYYYIYWDTVENGKKDGEFSKIYSGTKNAEFEESESNQWKNNSEPVIPINTGNIGGWRTSYAEDPVYGDQCYKIYRKGLLWQKDWYAKVYQNFKVPDGGNAQSYILHANVYLSSDITNVEWELTIDGNTVESGDATDGWQGINKNITSYLHGKSMSTISFRVYVTETSTDTSFKEVYAYFDSCWVETSPNCDVSVMENKSHGWWGDVSPVSKEYVAGVEGMNTIESINVTSIANPNGIAATIYSPDGKVAKSSLPLPDAGFEKGGAYTELYHSNEQTTSASFVGSAHSGSKAVELKLSDYSGKWKFEDQPVGKDDTVALRQDIAQSIHVSQLPSLWFWYNIEKYSSSSYLLYTVMTEGGENKHYTIGMGSLVKDGDWHKYEIPGNVLGKWKAGAGMVVGIEIRLVANEDGGENTVYIDDMGYSFVPNGADRTRWSVGDFYTFQNGTKVGDWRLDIYLADGSGYVVERSTSIAVKPSANLDVTGISAPTIIKEGDDASIVVSVKNHGPKDVEESVPINVSLTISQGGESYAVKMVKSLSGLKKGETKDVAFTWHAYYGEPSYNGEWTLVARVNENGDIPEWKKTDNWNTLFMDVIPLPDLEINMDDVGFDISHPVLNNTVNITAAIHNIGYNDTTAEISFYVKEKGARKYTIIGSGSIDKIIEKRNSESVYISWKPEKNGTYSIKVEAECQDESDTANNFAIKDIKVGGSTDSDSPYISNIRVTPSVQYLGESVNISATIYDNSTTIDSAVAFVYDSDGLYSEQSMERIGDTDVYYFNTTYDRIGYYSFSVRAFDTAGGGAEWQHMGQSENMTFRIVYEGVETIPPPIRAVTADPQKQVIYGDINISALINDSSGISKATLHVIHGGSESTYDMSRRGDSKVYYYSKSYDQTGEYTYYIEAVDSSSNANRNDTSGIFRYFTIPEDYDMDGIPDTVEIEAGADPKDSSGTINVTIGNETGYLLWKEDGKEYVYWDREDSSLRDTAEKVINDEKSILFDSDGDGSYDHYYGTTSGEIGIYEVVTEQGLGDLVWIIPAVILFAFVCLLFIAIRKK